jgi:hypothetical protein
MDKKKQVERAQLELQVIQDFNETFATPHGQRTLERIAKKCCENDDCYKSGKSTDDVLFDLGKRSVILFLRKQLNRIDKESKPKEAKNE